MGMMTQFPNPKMKPREQVAAKLISLDQDHFGFCPTCGMPIIEKAPLQQGKLVCSNCDAKFVRIDHEGQRFLVKVDSRLQKCPCGEGEVIVKANSKTGAPFAGCSRYPACKFTADHRNYINSIKPYFNPFQRNMPLPSPTTTNATVDISTTASERRLLRKRCSRFHRIPIADTSSGEVRLGIVQAGKGRPTDALERTC
jgi:ssDNA-binding Zn-finger/Zn-ribbon topoisomerase 1